MKILVEQARFTEPKSVPGATGTGWTLSAVLKGPVQAEMGPHGLHFLYPEREVFVPYAGIADVRYQQVVIAPKKVGKGE